MKREDLWKKEYAAMAYTSRHRQARMLRFFAKHASSKARARQLRNYRRAERRHLSHQLAKRRAWARGQG